MSVDQRESLHQIFRDLHAHRVQTMDPQTLQINIDQRKTLLETVDNSRFVKVGDVVEPFRLPEVSGGVVALEELVKAGPVVLIFFRFEGCPACNLALPYYQRNLLPGVRSAGASLVALSPQVPERLVEIKKRHALQYEIASDVGNELGRKFGILYAFDEPSRTSAIAHGRPIGQVTGTGTWELPMPTAIVLDRDRTVRFVDVHPDWLVRTEADEILDALAALSTRPRARSSASNANV